MKFERDVEIAETLGELGFTVAAVIATAGASAPAQAMVNGAGALYSGVVNIDDEIRKKATQHVQAVGNEADWTLDYRQGQFPFTGPDSGIASSYDGNPRNDGTNPEISLEDVRGANIENSSSSSDTDSVSSNEGRGGDDDRDEPPSTGGSPDIPTSPDEGPDEAPSLDDVAGGNTTPSPGGGGFTFDAGGGGTFTGDITGANIPVIFDLDGDGVEINVRGQTFFDVDGDGFREQTFWAASDDGFLVIDLNADGSRGSGDGNINQARELSFALWGNDGDTDLQGLRRAFDINEDGVLTAEDDVWNELKIWQDLDQDGETDDGELRSLEDWGISEINLTYDDGSDYDDHDDDITVFGNTLSGLASYTRDGEVVAGGVGDVALSYATEGWRRVETDQGYSIEFETGEVSRIAELEGSASANINLDDAVLDGAVGDSRDNALVAGGHSRSVQISGGSGDDTIAGGNNDDLLSGGAGSDFVRGWGGNDILFVDAADFATGIVDGGYGTDHIIVVGDEGVNIELSNHNLEGATGSDRADFFSAEGLYGEVAISGGGGNDTITGGAGGDLLSGDNGADIVNGGRGGDQIFGNLGHDRLYGQGGDDFLSGGDQHDSVLGGYGDDQLSGGHGTDWLAGASGDDRLDGGRGNDTLNGGFGDDILQGGGGHDLLFFWSGDDRLLGGAGNDIFRVQQTSQDDSPYSRGWAIIQGGVGDDTVFIDATSTEYSSIDHISGNQWQIMRHDDNGRTISLIDLQDIETVTFSDGVSRALSTDRSSDTSTSYVRSHDDRVFGEGDFTTRSDGEFWWSELVTRRNGDQVDWTETRWRGHYEDEFLRGWIGNDTLRGNDNADSIVGGAGRDEILGNDGNDTLNGSAGSDAVRGGRGNDSLMGGAGADYLVSDEGNDIANGGSGRDTVLGGEGADTLSGGTGDDVLSGGEDDDSVSGDDGDDQLFGNGGNDHLHGDLGSDLLVGGTGHDHLDGSYGADELLGGVGRDTLLGGDGLDFLYGGDGYDSLSGDDGDDWLTGGNGNDRLLGGSGRDTLEGGSGADILNGGGGILDLVSYSASESGVTVNLESGTATGGDAQGDSISNIENVLGSNHADRLTGNSIDNVLEGADGNDTLRAEGGHDAVHGGAGNDRIYAGSGDDRVWGGNGNDSVSLGDGDDVFSGEADDDSGEEDSSLNSDTVAGGNGHDTMSGSYGDDQFNGGTGNDALFGGSGSDTLEGAGGNDTLADGTGNDHLSGGDGRDLFVMSSDGERDVITDFSVAHDVIDISASDITSHLELRISQHGSNARIRYGAELIELQNTNASELTENNFRFSEASEVSSASAESDPSTARITYHDGDIGHDHFVMTNSQIVNSIFNFISGEDVIDISSWGVTSLSELSMAQEGENVQIRHGARLAEIHDTSISDVTRSSFIFDVGVNDTAEQDTMPEESNNGYTDVFGTSENDRNDTRLIGTSGNDRFYDGDGRDQMDGGSGRDIFIMAADDIKDEIYNFSFGQDIIDISAWGAISFSELSITQDGNHTRIRYGSEDLEVRQVAASNFGVSNFIFAEVDLDNGNPDNGGGADAGYTVITARSSGGELHGASGADRIEGRSGNDRLYGREGNDLLIDGTGSDRLHGGTG
ncbi:Ca2+-binding protein, RTX toxin-related, partial [Epibacterium ulvae]